MKQLIIILFILLLAVQSFYQLAIISAYYSNKDYIAAVLCENKNKPKMHCNGKCFLKKQLRKAEEEQQKDAASFKFSEPLVYITHPVQLQTEAITYAVLNTDYPAYAANHYSFLFAASCFRPPGAVCSI